jgi:endonuclease/exonuclease/phosphatase family metal-dependent hydrolase
VDRPVGHHDPLVDVSGDRAVSVTGVAVHWTVRDGRSFATNLFYALPLIVIAGILLAAGVVWMRNRRPVFSAACAVAALLVGGLWIYGGYFTNECGASTDRLRIFTWNTARGFATWPTIAEQVGKTDPDLIGLVEAGGSTKEWQQFWAQHFPDHQIYLAGGGLAILTRGEIVDKSIRRLVGTSACADVRIEFDGRPVRVLLIDAVVHPFSNRSEVVGKAFELARETPELPTIVMGDFNTPTESVWFDEVRHDFTHAFEQAGRGMLTTWPAPAPILAIDHVWLSRQFQIDCASIGWSWASDHRPIVVDVRLHDEGSE